MFTVEEKATGVEARVAEPDGCVLQAICQKKRAPKVRVTSTGQIVCVLTTVSTVPPAVFRMRVDSVYVAGLRTDHRFRLLRGGEMLVSCCVVPAGMLPFCELHWSRRSGPSRELGGLTMARRSEPSLSGESCLGCWSRSAAAERRQFRSVQYETAPSSRSERSDRPHRPHTCSGEY